MQTKSNILSEARSEVNSYLSDEGLLLEMVDFMQSLHILFIEKFRNINNSFDYNVKYSSFKPEQLWDLDYS